MFVIHLFDNGFGRFDGVVLAVDGKVNTWHVGRQYAYYLTVVSEADYTH
jgi:hypothetical protein